MSQMPDKTAIATTTDVPSPTGVPRDTRGRWLPGHGSPGPGNPHWRALSTWRAALAAKVTRADIEHVISVLVKEARKGERWAVTELLDRCLGRPVQHTILESDDTGPRYKVLINIAEDQL